ncbi:MAG: alpha-1,2-fucosyltransferase [Chitinophagaceae bacterium]
MVISHLFGGLGNQLFQYAAGKRIAEKYSVPFALDTSAFESYKLRRFDLDHFNLQARIATETEITELKPSSNLAKALQYLRLKKNRTYHRERSFNFDPSFESIGPDIYLKGYFQSEQYFAPIAPTVLKEFTIKPEFIQNVTALAGKIRNPNSVGIHIRRGDYKNTDVKQLLATTDADYYQRAIALMLEKLTDPEFYFFSDDIDWVRENLPVPNAVYVSGDLAKTHIEDFYLLSQCGNQIIPNSTFAWWAAWLNPNPAKSVIAPQKWFNDEASNRDRLPESWTSL